MTLTELAETFGGQTPMFGDDEAEYMPTFNAQSGNWKVDAFDAHPMREELPIPQTPPFSARFGNLSFEVDEERLGALLTEHSLSAESVRLPRDIEGRVRGSAFIDFATRDDLVRALSLRGTQFLGRNLDISVAERRGGPPGMMNAASFDWSVRDAPQGGSGFSARAPQPDFEWGARDSQNPLARFSAPPRAAHPSRFESDFNWGEREQQAPAQRAPRPRAPAPSFDNWGERDAGSEPRQQRPRQPRIPDNDLDWSARDSVPRASQRRSRPRFADDGKDWNARGAEKPAPTPAPAPTAQQEDPREAGKQEQARRLKTLKKSGFGVLEED